MNRKDRDSFLSRVGGIILNHKFDVKENGLLACVVAIPLAIIAFVVLTLIGLVVNLFEKNKKAPDQNDTAQQNTN